MPEAKHRHHQLFGWTIDHEKADLKTREHYSIASSELKEAYQRLERVLGSKDNVILSTCNRLLLFGQTAPNVDLSTQLDKWGSEQFGSEFLQSADQFRLITGDAEVTQHLLEVGIGLRSQVLGEPDILGQLKDALGVALEYSGNSRLLQRLRNSIVNQSVRIRAETSISKSRTSLFSLAGDAIGGFFGAHLRDQAVVLVGTGRSSRAMLRILRGMGCEQIFTSSRSRERAEVFSRENGTVPFDLADLMTYVRMAGLLVTSLDGSPDIIDTSAFRVAVQDRKRMPLFIVDLGVPRNLTFDLKARWARDLYYQSTEQLGEIANKNQAMREAAAEEAGYFLGDAVEAVTAKIRQVTDESLTKEYRSWLQKHLKAETANAVDGLPEEQAKQVASAMRLLANRVAHLPTVMIKNTEIGEDVIREVIEDWDTKDAPEDPPLVPVAPAQEFKVVAAVKKSEATTA